MGSTFGRTIFETAGRSIQVSADGRPEAKIAGLTVDWSTIAALAGADITLDDGVVIHVGDKYLRYGQVLCLIGGAEVQTVTFTGGPTSGSALVTLPAGADAVNQPAQTTAAIAAAATAAAFEAALTALSRIGPNGASVARTGAGTAGDPYVYTVTLNRQLGDVPQFTSTNTFGGGTTPSVTHGTTTAGAGTGLYGPYDPAASDGRATLSRGSTFVTAETIREDEIASNYPPVISGGSVFKERILATSGAASLAAGPTWANLLAALPRLEPVAELP
jgi:hypothetical protein